MLRAGHFAFLLLTTAAVGLADSGQIELVSRAPAQQAPDTTGGSFVLSERSLSSDGRYLVILSAAANLVPGQADANGSEDVFLYDRVAGTTTLVSHVAGSADRTGDGASASPAISADGQWIAFVSDAVDLVPGLQALPGSPRRLFLYERATGEVTLAGGPSRGSDFEPFLSADGSWIVFSSFEADGNKDLYFHERASGTTTLASRSIATLDGLSADGAFAVFARRGPRDSADVFLYNRLTASETLVSHAAGSPLTEGNRASYSPRLSASGQFVAFVSEATDLLPGLTDNNGRPDVFLYDRLTGSRGLITRDPARPNATNPTGGFEPVLSADGNTVAWFDNVPRSGRGGHLFVTDRVTGATTHITRGANGGAREASLSRDGRLVAFATQATNVVAGQREANPQTPDVFLHDRASGTTVLVSHAAGSLTSTGKHSSYSPWLSADGRWLAYGSVADDLEAGRRDAQGPDVFLYETATALNRTVTLHAPGLASLSPYSYSESPGLSGDGRFVVFTSFAGNLVPGPVDGNSGNDVFLWDRTTGGTTLVSHASASPLETGDGTSESPLISRDGGVVVFASVAPDLVAGQKDEPGTIDVFLWDRLTGRTTLVSRSSSSPLRAANGLSIPVQVSADGNTVLFRSAATNLVPRQRDRNGREDLFLFDRRTGVVTLVSRTTTSPAHTGNAGIEAASLSADGSVVAFTSYATDLTPGTPRGETGSAFVYTRSTGRVTRLVVGRSSAPVALGNAPLLSANGRYVALLNATGTRYQIVLLDRVSGAALPVGPVRGQLPPPLGLSGNGRFLLFRSDAAHLVPGQDDGNRSEDLFLFDRVTRETRLVSHLPGRPLQASRYGAFQGQLSADGRHVAFVSNSPELEPAPAANRSDTLDVFLYDRATDDVTLVSGSLFYPGRGGNGQSRSPVISASGGFVAFVSEASDLVPRDFNLGFTNVDVFLYIP